MRKDLRIGLGIGGVLLLVLIVALVVKSNGNKKIAEAPPPGTQEQPDNSATGAEAGTPATPGDSTSPPASESNPLPPHSSDPFAGDTPAPGTSGTASAGSTGGAAGGGSGMSSSAWTALLSGQTDSSIHTATPAAAAGSARSGGSGTGVDSRTASIPSPLAASDRGDPDSIGGASARRGGAPDLLGPGASSVGARTNGRGDRSRAGSGFGAAAAAGQRPYVVQQGDTFVSIAASLLGNSRYYLQIAEANRNVNPNALRPGTVIVLPEIGASAAGTRAAPAPAPAPAPAARAVRRTSAAAGGTSADRDTYVVRSGDSLYRISNKLYNDGAHVDALYEANKAAIGPDRAHLKLGMVLKLPAPPTVASGR